MDYFKINEAMDYLGIKSYDTLKRVIENGLPVISIGNTKRIRKSDIDKFMADHTVIKTKEAK